MRLLIFICVLSVSSGKNFISDPVCPAATAQSSCAGRRSTCWSPGVRDLDCPGSGLCCYDGCANTCVSESRGSASIQQPQYSPPPTNRRPYQPPTTTRRPYQPPSTTRRTYQPPTTTKAPYRPPPFNSYIPPAPKPVTFPQQSYIPPLASPTPSYTPPQPQPRPTPSPSYGPPLAEVQQPSIKVEVVRPTSRPTHGGSGSCPRATPLSQASCGGRHSTCWSPGVADLDCPNWGLCCFDGCANTCLGSTPAPRQPRPPRNPCDPNPCGPGSMCIPQEGEPECKCPEGLVPNPTPAQGCVVPNPCDPNPCGDGSMCIPNEGRPTCKCPEGLVPDPTPEVRCSARDPCDPSPCGPGTTCTPNRDGNPICRCLVGLIPKPDTITGCGPECVIDPDCDGGLVCLDRKCVDKPDPCNPSPCGPGTTCSANRDGNPICRCLSGLIPKPDTITGCGPECVVDPDCLTGYICNQQKCVEKPDPCDPNPCGEGALCLVQGGSFSCECPTGFVGNGNTGCFRGECIVDDDCSSVTACQNYYCTDPCLSGTCDSADFCRVMQHNPTCGYNYDPPTTTPKDEFVIGGRYNKNKPSPPSNQIVIGARHEPRPQSPNNPFAIGGTEQQRMMMMMMDTSRLPVIGASFNRRKRHLLRRRELYKR